MRAYRSSRTVLTALLGAALLFQALPARGAAWSIEDVDAPCISRNLTDRSLRLGPDDLPRAAFGGDHLYYASFNGQSWRLETADPSERVGEHASLALDAAANPHIAYYDALNGDLKHAWRGSSGWESETVDSAGDVGAGTSIAADAAGRVHITYRDATNGDLKYARLDPGGWLFEVVDGAGDPGLENSLALDAAGEPRVAYWDGLNSLRYASRGASGWQVETVDTGSFTQTGRWPSLVLDAGGDPHVAYMGLEITYAWKDSSGWHRQPTVNLSGQGISLALGTDGQPRLSFMEIDTLIFARRLPEGGWNDVWLRGGQEGGLTSLAVGADGRARVLFGGGDGSVRLATEDARGWDYWDYDRVARGGEAGRALDFAVDRRGRPLLAYSFGDNRFLDWTISYQNIFTSREGGVWRRVELAGEELTTGPTQGLALDAGGRPHVFYHQEENFGSANVHAWRDETGWHRASVPEGSATVDAEGRLHIVQTGDYRRLIYLRQDDSGWHVTPLDQYGSRPVIRLDGQGRPGILYRGNRWLIWAHQGAGGWSRERVAQPGTGACGRPGNYTLDLRPAGRPAAAYIRESHGLDATLNFAWRTGTGWRTELVDAADSCSRISLAFDPAGTPHIAYRRGGLLRHAWRDDFGWHTEEVEGAGAGEGISVILAWPADAVTIAFFDPERESLRLATRHWTYTSFIGGSVFYDLDGDGSRGPAEPGLAGVAVELTAPGGLGVHQVETAADGSFIFSGFHAGDYSVRVDTGDPDLPLGAYLSAGANPWALGLGDGESFDGVLFGFGVAAPNGDVRLDRRRFDFGPVPVGTPSVRPTLRVTNLDLVPRTVEGLGLAGADRSAFRLPEDRCSWQTLAPGESCTFDLLYRPRSAGEKRAAARVTFQTESGPKILSAALKGEEFPEVTLLVPNGGVDMRNTNDNAVIWGAPAEAAWFRLHYSPDGGGRWVPFGPSRIYGNRYSWVIPLSISGGEFKVKVVGYDSSGRKVGEDESDFPFVIWYDTPE